MNTPSRRPLIAHVVHRLGVGGVENGVVNLINRIDRSAYRHAIVCLSKASEFRARLDNPDVQIVELHRPASGQDWAVQSAAWKAFRELKPAVVHTRNLATIECVVAARAAGVPRVIHGEHGWDVHDLDGSVKRYQIIRRTLRPFIHHFIALSRHQVSYLRERIGVPARRLDMICNGVDLSRFSPERNRAGLPAGFADADSIVVGTVGRMMTVKNNPALAEAFVKVCQRRPEFAPRMRIALIGGGPDLETCERILTQGGLREQAWLPGHHDDIPSLLSAFDIFVLPSRAEGISNTILEAMACGLPVVANEVGGNADLVVDEETGYLTTVDDPPAMVSAIDRYLENPSLIKAHGKAGRLKVERQHSLEFMVGHYHSVYDRVLRGAKWR